MTVTTELARKSFPWTGVETAFACGFPAEDVSHLKVFFTTTAGITSGLTIGINYSASLAAGTNIATVLPILIPAAAGTITVERRTPALVTEVLADGQDFSLEVIQRMHDRAIMIAAEYRTRLSRAIVLEDGSEAGSGAFDMGGNRLTNLAAGLLASDAATVGQLQGIGVGQGNVPAPVIGQTGWALFALGANNFGWAQIPGIGTGAIATAMLAAGILSADAAGLGKMADGYLTTVKLADGALSADATGRAKMADAFFAAAASSRAKFADGFWGANEASRLKFADAFWGADEISRAKFADKFLTLAKIDDVASGILLGRKTASSGPLEQLGATDIRGLIAGSIGQALLAAADEPAARLAILAPAAPKSGSGVGQWLAVNTTAGNGLVLPGGGTWAWGAFGFASSGTNISNQFTAGVSAGGTTVLSGAAGNIWTGFAWRIA